ncbi:hypothetical protein SO802_013197 [Lithocarpus litseifolius]|uniref:Uncharacterized protein n=1 Tax=Lithocarpus litseifolius TaxID=425828 RepID=A0AAW2D5N8_9ROSI
MIPACFSQPNTVSSNNNTSNHQVPQNLITCIYQTHLCNSPTYLTLTWSKTLFSHSLTIYATDSFSITISLNPSTFSFFKTRPGSKSIYLTHHHYQRIKLYWDFTRAEFSRNSAEPDSGFYVAISCNAKLEFFLGDLHDELTRRSGLALTRQLSEPTLLSRREHVFGRRNYVSRAQFLGIKHEIGIECSGGVLKVKVDGEIRLVVNSSHLIESENNIFKDERRMDDSLQVAHHNFLPENYYCLLKETSNKDLLTLAKATFELLIKMEDFLGTSSPRGRICDSFLSQ